MLKQVQQSKKNELDKQKRLKNLKSELAESNVTEKGYQYIVHTKNTVDKFIKGRKWSFVLSAANLIKKHLGKT